MKLFEVRIKNDRQWVSSGALGKEVYVLAMDFMEATVKADTVLQALKERLARESQGKIDVTTLTVRYISELGSVVDDVATKHGDDIESWVAATASSAVKDVT